MEGVQMRARIVMLALLACLVAAFAAAPGAGAAQGAIEEATVSLSSNGLFTRQAGGHPDLTFDLTTPLVQRVGPNGPYLGVGESLRVTSLDLPVGFVGNPTAVPTCTEAELLNEAEGGAICPVASQVGVVSLLFADFHDIYSGGILPVFNMAHGPDTPAEFGFTYQGYPTLIKAGVRPQDYGVSSGTTGVPQVEPLRGFQLTIWGVPADPSHDSLRGARGAGEIPDAGNSVSSEAPLRPLLTSPTSCSTSGMSFVARAETWQNQGIFDVRPLTTDEEGTPFAFEGCGKLQFAPSLTAQPTSSSTEAPSGLGVDIKVPQNESGSGIATSQVRSVSMTLPTGMSVSPSSASGLGACSEAEVGLGSNAAPTCPESSKIGSVRIKTPLLEEELEGGMYLARQRENPFGSLLALYLIVKGPGFYLKLPGKVVTDSQTGQLNVTFSNTPQLPFEELHVDLKSGSAAPLQMPRTCGSYPIKAEITPWSGNAPVDLESTFAVNQNCSTGGFSPKLRAGSIKSAGGSYSPFTLQVTRADGEANLSRIQATLPPGLLAKLAGVPLCGDVQAATGDCPASSQVGTTTVGAGPGPNPVYVPEAGKAPTAVYLAGPYKGAPYSLVVKVPAQAGPFDLGTVVVRNALRVDPTTTQVTAESDPLPQILEGIPVTYRDVRVEVNRPEFTINPTNCSQFQVAGVLTSASGQSASPTAPFAATDCERLDFKPTLALQMSGQTKRAGNPALTATLKAPAGQANIASTTVILPKSAFIDQRHVNGPCTRVQFAADACPASSVLGTATAWSPLLDRPLEGPVYFRSNGGERQLPDIVADLDGQIHVVLVGFIDSKKAGGETSLVRTRFASVPDAPVSKFVLKLKGGKRGLIQNSADLCKAKPKAEVKMEGQNGKTDDFEQKIAVKCGKPDKKSGAGNKSSGGKRKG